MAQSNAKTSRFRRRVNATLEKGLTFGYTKLKSIKQARSFYDVENPLIRLSLFKTEIAY